MLYLWTWLQTIGSFLFRLDNDSIPDQEALDVFRHWTGRLGEGLRDSLQDPSLDAVTLDRRVAWLKMLILVVAVLVISVAIWWLTRRILLVVVHRLAAKTRTTWDDELVKARFFARLANVAPALFISYCSRYVFEDFPQADAALVHVIDAVIVWIAMMVIIAFLKAVQFVLQKRPRMADKPISSYVQLGKIVTYFVFGVLVISVLVGKSPIYFFSAMGAMTAVLILVFKDTILGFVASIQLAANDMVRVGDWVTMEKYGADGDITEINLTTVKVKNFDKTITTIPTYAFIADSFKNWRGMEESPGRRIKRAVILNVTSVKFCDQAMVDKFKKIELVKPYLIDREKEIAEYNRVNNIDKSELVNGRHLTNIGVFRAYMTAYLKQNKELNHDMTLMVRQLDPTELGVPLEIYAFSKDKNWANYEYIVADIFDHILSSVPHFELEIFQNPTGADFQQLGG